jgi:hypothetical protein
VFQKELFNPEREYKFIQRNMRPQERKRVQPLLLDGDDHYRFLHLDMLQQFLIPQLDDDQEGCIHFQAVGLVERRR